MYTGYGIDADEHDGWGGSTTKPTTRGNQYLKSTASRTDSFTGRKVQVYIHSDTYARLCSIVRAAEGEVSGFGLVRQLDNFAFCIDEIKLPSQVCTSGHTEIDDDAVHAAIAEYSETLGLWWHSHAKMSTFWSGEDEDTIVNWGSPWMLNLVVNKAGDWKIRADLAPSKDIPIRITLDCELNILFVADEVSIAAEVKEMVRERTVVVSKYPSRFPAAKANSPAAKKKEESSSADSSEKETRTQLSLEAPCAFCPDPQMNCSICDLVMQQCRTCAKTDEEVDLVVVRTANHQIEYLCPQCAEMEFDLGTAEIVGSLKEAQAVTSVIPA